MESVQESCLDAIQEMDGLVKELYPIGRSITETEYIKPFRSFNAGFRSQFARFPVALRSSTGRFQKTGTFETHS